MGLGGYISPLESDSASESGSEEFGSAWKSVTFGVCDRIEPGRQTKLTVVTTTLSLIFGKLPICYVFICPSFHVPCDVSYILYRTSNVSLEQRRYKHVGPCRRLTSTGPDRDERKRTHARTFWPSESIVIVATCML